MLRNQDLCHQSVQNNSCLLKSVNKIEYIKRKETFSTPNKTCTCL